MSSELPQASNNDTQQMILTAGRQRRKESMSNGEPNNKSKHEALQTEKHDYEESVSSGKQVKKTASNRMAASNQSDYYIKQANQNNSRINSSVQSRLLLITKTASHYEW
jgi:hypothetical protein